MRCEKCVYGPEPCGRNDVGIITSNTSNTINNTIKCHDYEKAVCLTCKREVCVMRGRSRLITECSAKIC